MTETTVLPSNLLCAKTYARRGWAVFPVHSPRDGGVCSCGDPSCRSPGKHPRTATGLKEATTDIGKIQVWWDTWPDANIGVVTGRTEGAALLCVDIDPRHGGNDTLNALELTHGILPPHLIARTGGGGSHHIFTIPDGERIRSSSGKLGPGVDVKGEGGYFIAAPSLHVSGKRYEWVNLDPILGNKEHRPEDNLPPAWLLELLGNGKPSAPGTPGPSPIPEKITEGVRNDTLFRLAASLRARGLGMEAIQAALLVENRARCQPPLPEDEVRSIAESAGRYLPGALPPVEVERGEVEALAQVDLTDLVNREFLTQCETLERELAARAAGPGVGAPPPPPPRGHPPGPEEENPIRKMAEELAQEMRGERELAARRRITITEDTRLREQTDAAFTVLLRGNDPPWIFVRCGELSRVTTDEKGTPRIEALSPGGLRYVLERVGDFVSVTYQKNKVCERTMKPPLDVVTDLKEMREWPGVPGLEAVIEAPTLLGDNTLIWERGYNAAARVYYLPAAGFTMPPIPDIPTGMDVRAAAGVVSEVFRDFPFDCEASRCGCYAALLTAVLRPMIRGLVPMALIDKPQAGTGASLITDVISHIAAGRSAAMRTPPRTDEEWEKVITALLRAGNSVVVFDNLAGKLYAPALAKILTATTHGARILGTADDIQLPNRVTWIATGNNVQLGGDLPRRCYWIRMDAEAPVPWQRTGFLHPDLMGWVSAERGKILAAVLTLARVWILAGKPGPDPEKVPEMKMPGVKTPGVPRLGGYEEWRETVGGILHHAGLPGFLGNLDEMYKQSDVESQEWMVFLSALQAHFPMGMTTAEIVEHIQLEKKEQQTLTDPDPDLAETLPSDIVEGKGDLARRVGKGLARKKDHIFLNRLVLRKGSTEHSAITWIVELHVSPPIATPPQPGS